MSTVQKNKLNRRLKKGSLPKFANDLDVDSLNDAQCGKINRDIAKYDKDNNQSHFSSDVRGGKRRRSTKRRRTKRRSTKRRRTKRRRTKRRRRKR